MSKIDKSKELTEQEQVCPDNSQTNEGDEKDEDQANPEAELLSRLPPELRQRVSSFLSISHYGSPRSPIQEKITSEHIATMLEIDKTRLDKESSYQYFHDFKNLLYLVIAIVTLGLVVVYFGKDNMHIITQFIGYLGAFAGGFGTAKTMGY